MRAPLSMLAAASMLALSACATITTGTHQSLTVLTPGVVGARCVVLQPDQLPVAVDQYGEVIVPRMKAPLTVECEKEGYQRGRATLKSGVDSHAKFELPAGYVIDAASGARYRYPSLVTVEMTARQ